MTLDISHALNKTDVIGTGVTASELGGVDEAALEARLDTFAEEIEEDSGDDIATEVTARDGAIDFSGGSIGHVLQVVAGGALELGPLPEAPLPEEVTLFIIGSGAPGAEIGDDGDGYFDKVGRAIYGPKAAGAWGTGVSLDATLADDAVTNAKLANVATSTIKGRVTSGTGDPEDLTVAQVRTLLNVADGAQVNPTAAEIVTLLEALSGTDRLSWEAIVGLSSAGAGALYEIALQARSAAQREAHIHAMIDEVVGDDEIVQKKAGGFDGLPLIALPAALPSDQAEGVSEVLQNTLASAHFWRMQQTVSISDSSPLNLRLIGTSNTPGTANHTLNVLVSDVNAACPWQVQDIATGLEGVEGKVTFQNTGATARNCFPQTHATSGATVRYSDDVEQADLVLPTGANSRLTVFYEVIADGATGTIEITGFRKRTA